jgi:hypothetical protein
MPLIINDSFTHLGEKDSIRKEIKQRADIYSASINEIKEIDLVFLKSCGYYENLIDEILEHIGYTRKSLEKIGVSVKIKTLTSIIPYVELVKSTELYQRILDTRNQIAHSSIYRLEKDTHFIERILGLKKSSSVNVIKNEIMKYFVDLYAAPMFIITGILFNNTENPFLIFQSKSSCQSSK